jgi:SAM-dependent methyltransferase
MVTVRSSPAGGVPSSRETHVAAQKSRWRHYIQAVGERPPSRELLEALARFDRPETARPPSAVDMGCGRGRDTRELLARGWRVLAVDGEWTALEALHRQVPAEERGRLTMCCSPFEGLDPLPRCDLVNAAMSLPFVRPPEFARVWRIVVRAIRPGGRFSGTFIGTGDEWARSSPGMTFHTARQIEELFNGFQIERLREERGRRPTIVGGSRRGHVISVIAVRRAR